MIIEVTEIVYKGILVEHVKEGGWKCNLGGQVYLFPHLTLAQAAIDETFKDLHTIIKKTRGIKFKE